jgi:CubicO group peptidase (beta-lactamase class C family)
MQNLFFKRSLSIFAVLAILAGARVIGSQTLTPDKLAEIEKAIEAEMTAAKTPGAAVAVISADKVIFAKGFGTTSVEGGAAVTVDTLFRMGSTTKMFTAAAILALAESGKVRLTAPVGTYVKDLSPKVAALSAHQLLSQSSGLRDFNPLASGNDDAALGQNIRLWKDDVFFTEPDKIYSYSSANYWLAGYLAEELTGKPYADALAELVLRPLGMNRSTIRSFEAMTYPMALGHMASKGAVTVVRPIDNNAAKYPGGSMYSSVNELSRFAIAMLNGGRLEGRQAIPASMVEALQKPQFYLPGDEKAFYGYGLLGYDDSGVRTVSHGGVSRGYGSTIFFAPDQKIAVIVLANTNGQTLPKTRRKIMELLLPLVAQKPAQPPTQAVDLSRYAGKYSHAPQTWTIVHRDGKLFVSEEAREFELKQTGKNEFSYDQGQILFAPNAAGEFEHIFMGLYAAKRVS